MYEAVWLPPPIKSGLDLFREASTRHRGNIFRGTTLNGIQPFIKQRDGDLQKHSGHVWPLRTSLPQIGPIGQEEIPMVVRGLKEAGLAKQSRQIQTIHNVGEDLTHDRIRLPPTHNLKPFTFPGNDLF